jgi:hypothetical protein
MSVDGDIEDIEACAREGRRPRDVGPYRILVGDALMRFEVVIVDEPIFSGRALRDHAALHPPEHHVVFAVLSDGLIEEIRLEETIDLRSGVERFIGLKSDRLFRFLIDGSEFQWGGVFITGATVLKLAKLDVEHHGVTMRLADGGEQAIGRTTLVDLSQTGVEEFVTARLSST